MHCCVVIKVFKRLHFGLRLNNNVHKNISSINKYYVICIKDDAMYVVNTMSLLLHFSFHMDQDNHTVVIRISALLTVYMYILLYMDITGIH
jgi:hypothetical protein